MTEATMSRRSVTSLTLRVLDVVDRAGNKLPHPFWLFVILSGLVVATSALLAGLGVSVESPTDGSTIRVNNILSGDGVQMMLADMIVNYVNFPPLGLIVVIMLGVAVANGTGLLPALMRAALQRVPAGRVTFVLALTCMFAHVAGDAAFLVMIPLGMIAFRAVGRSPDHRRGRGLRRRGRIEQHQPDHRRIGRDLRRADHRSGADDRPRLLSDTGVQLVLLRGVLVAARDHDHDRHREDRRPPGRCYGGRRAGAERRRGPAGHVPVRGRAQRRPPGPGSRGAVRPRPGGRRAALGIAAAWRRGVASSTPRCSTTSR